MSDNKFLRLLQSRKFWAFVAALVGLVSASLQNDGMLSAEEIQAIAGLVIGYIISVAYEDGKQAEAVGRIGAADVGKQD